MGRVRKEWLRVEILTHEIAKSLARIPNEIKELVYHEIARTFLQVYIRYIE
jgi:hypothetical protein